ncbi:MAG: hypothetical protein Q4F75_08140, partial [Pseudomonadota bacterium]|nr:hypothetical protein [Pseudomonadota bacterium]
DFVRLEFSRGYESRKGQLEIITPLLTSPTLGEEYKEASVCFITDTGECSDNKFGNSEDVSGGNGNPGGVPDYDTPAEQCQDAGYTQSPCPEGSVSVFCPADPSYHICKCSADYNQTCTAPNQGVGEACDGKYKECCNTCPGYDYSAIPAGYVSAGECDSCDGKKYQIKCDTSLYPLPAGSCGSLGGSGGSCTDDTGTYYKQCNCPLNEVWDAGQKKCVCSSGFKYSCNGTGYVGGEGKECNRKYSKCTCAEGYEWKNEKCEKKSGETLEQGILGQCTGYAKNCSIGQILNSDGTCTGGKVSGKTPIGVVVYIGGDGCGQALALKDLGGRAWSTGFEDVPGLPNSGSTSAAESDYDSCGNTQKIIQAGDAAEYPAAWAAVTYAPASAPGTKGKWCLPAAGIGRSMMDRRSVINAALATAEGDVWLTRANPAYWNWTSSELDDAHAWAFMTNRDDGLNFSSREERRFHYFVRPVIAF